MPIYEYECLKCGEIFEEFQRLSDPPPSSHSCGSKKVRRVMSRSSFVLKGDGWYITDYARKEKKGADKGSKSATKSESGDKSSSDKTSSASGGDKSGSASS